MWQRLIGRIWPAYKKAALRAHLSATSAQHPGPFDIEAKIIRTITINPPGVIDIGAHVGVYASVLEDIVGSHNLYLFEPLPQLYRRLRWNFPRAHVFHTVLYDHPRHKCMRVLLINGKHMPIRATLNHHTEPRKQPPARLLY